MPQSDTSRPNILFIFPDQWRGDCLSVLGHPVVETPFLDQLGHDGVIFTSAYTPCPSCIAARAALITGMSPSSAGRMGYRDGVPWPYANTFMRLLRDHGYQTLCAGKTHFHPARARLGFEELALYEMPNQDLDNLSDYHLWLREQTAGAVRDIAQELDSNSYLAHPWTQPEHLHPNSWTVSAAIEQLERRDTTRPFFLQLSPHRPHPPYDPPISYYERYQDRELPPVPVGDWATDNDRPVDRIDPSSGRLPSHVLDRTRRAYYAQIAHLDYQFGRLFRYLKARRLLETTWIVFASDHGEMLGDHHLYRKTNALEGSAHVPLIIKPPNGTELRRGLRCDRPVTLADLAPTFLNLGSVAAPDDIEASSLLPLVRGDTVAWRDFIHGEHTPGWQFVTDGKEKFVWFSRDDRRWFFDLAADPQERCNRVRAPEYSERVKTWEDRLIATLATRPQDKLTDGTELTPGGCAPTVRPWLLETPGAISEQ